MNTDFDRIIAQVTIAYHQGELAVGCLYCKNAKHCEQKHCSCWPELLEHTRRSQWRVEITLVNSWEEMEAWARSEGLTIEY